jgi:PIN domain-containing protein
VARKPRTPRWYVDADTLGLAHVLIRSRRDVTYCGDDGKRHNKSWEIEPCVVQDTATPDDVWIPAVTRHGLAIITRDKHIQTRTAEKDQVLAVGARMFAITSPENLDIWGLVEVVVTQWRKMEVAATEPGPYIYALTRTSLSKIPLISE